MPGTPVNVPYKFTGKELDTASNLYFYESRYYHPIFGRFISPDTIVPSPHDPQSLNRYSYARNNPLLYTDPSGHFFFPAFLGLGSLFGIGGGAAAGTSAFTSVSAVNHAVETAAVNEVRRGIDSVVRNRAYAFNPYRTYLDFERALLIGPVGFGIDALTGHHIANAQQTRVAGYVRSSYLVTAAAVAATFCGGCTLKFIGPILQGAYMGAAVGSASGLAQAAFAGMDPSQAVIMGALIGAAGGSIGGGITGKLGSYLSTLSFGGAPIGPQTFMGQVVSGATANFAGSVVGSSVGGGFASAVGGTNIGKGFGFGALGGAFSGAMAIAPFGPIFDATLGEPGGFISHGINGVFRSFANGGIDWTSGWLGTKVEEDM